MASKRHLNDNGASALSIDLRWNGFGTQGARAIAPALQYNSMTECMLRGNGIGVDGWATIFKTLSDNPASRVSTWDLSGEHLGPNIAEPLARYISVTTSLTKLSLAKNELGEAGTKIICESMKGNNTLKEIDLSGDSYFGSNIDRAAGAEHVADLLRVTDSLTECNLRNNLLKEESAKKLAKIGTEKRITLFGIRHGQTEADFRGDRLDFVDAILIGNDLVVTTSLTSVPHAIDHRYSLSVGFGCRKKNLHTHVPPCSIGQLERKHDWRLLSGWKFHLHTSRARSNCIGNNAHAVPDSHHFIAQQSARRAYVPIRDQGWQIHSRG